MSHSEASFFSHSGEVWLVRGQAGDAGWSGEVSAAPPPPHPGPCSQGTLGGPSITKDRLQDGRAGVEGGLPLIP